MSESPEHDRSAGRWTSSIMLGIFLWSVVLAFGVWLRWHDRYRGWRAAIIIVAALLFLATWNLLIGSRRKG